MSLRGASCLQDRSAGTMHFSLARPGMLKHFEGQWTVSAVEGERLSGCLYESNFRSVSWSMLSFE